jgi:hypothetical protein
MFPTQPTKRVALLGLMLESNSFAPGHRRDDFLKRLYVAGDEFARNSTGRNREFRRNAELPRNHGRQRRVGAGPDPDGARRGRRTDRSRLLRGSPGEMRTRSRRRCRSMPSTSATTGAMITTEERDPTASSSAMVRERCRPDAFPSSPRSTCTATSPTAWWRWPTSSFLLPDQSARRHGGAGPGRRPPLSTRCSTGCARPPAIIRLPVTPPTVTLLTEAGPLRRSHQLRSPRLTARHPQHLHPRRLRLRRHAQERARHHRHGAQRQGRGREARQAKSPSSPGRTTSATYRS